MFSQRSLVQKYQDIIISFPLVTGVYYKQFYISFINLFVYFSSVTALSWSGSVERTGILVLGVRQ